MPLKLISQNLCRINRCSLMFCRNASGKWRADNNLPPRYAQSTVLSESPEWSYIDGRGYGPLNSAQRARYYRDARWTDEVIKITESMRVAKRLVPTSEQPQLKFRERIAGLDKSRP